ncbi:MAG: HAD family phosphatase [Eubacteriales bacterium]|nr:HAD family phosphatase [Eubacteriales bacterium]
MKRFKNIIFDVGDVLLEYRWKEMLMDYGLSEDEAFRVGAQVFKDPDNSWRAFDMGATEEEMIDLYCKKYPADSEAVTWFIRHGEYMHVARPKVWKLVHELKEHGYNVYLLSNYPETLFKKHTQYADFMNDIDGLMVSYMINQAKPDRAIYDALCQKYGLNAQECLFFDDRMENVDGAKNAGMDAIQVVSQEQLIGELKKLIF